MSNDTNRPSNLNSKVRFKTGYVLTYIQETSKLEQLEIQTQRANCFLPRKKKRKRKCCLNLFYKFIEFCVVLFYQRGFRNLKFCWLQITVLISFFFFKLAPRAMYWTLICLDLFNSWLTVKWSFILMGPFYSCCNLTQ